MASDANFTVLSYTRRCCLLCWPWISSSASAIIAYKMRNVDFKYRWFLGVVTSKCVQYIQNYANDEWKQLLPPHWRNGHISTRWLAINTMFAMQFASGWSPMFGGNKYFKKRNIDSYKKAVIASLCPGQVFFRKNKNARKKAIKNILKIAASFGIGYTVSKLITSGLISAKLRKAIENNIVVHMELLALFAALLVFLNNIPSNVHYFIFGGNDDIEVIEPYGFVYSSKSIREFWKHWSRPVGEMLRYMVYEPFGGRDRFWISVPAVFLANLTLHYDFSMNVYGDRSIGSWNKAFGIMGISITLFMFTENIFLKHKANVNKSKIQHEEEQDMNIEESTYWKIWSFGLFHASMIPTLYILHKTAFCVNIETICNTYLGDMIFEID